MSGTVRYKDGAWRIAYQADGRRHYATVHGPNNKPGRRAAESTLAQLVTQIDAGRHRGDATTTFADLVDEWETIQAPKLEATTAAGYRYDLARVLPDLGGRRLARITGHDLDRLYARLRQNGYSPKTVANTHGTISAVLGHATRWGWIDTNPAIRADPGKVTRQRITIPTPAQVKAIIGNSRPDFAAYLRAAATTGHRRGSLLGLRWTDLDLDQHTVTFERAIAATTGELHVKGTKADRADTITLGASVADALRQHRARTGTARARRGPV